MKLIEILILILFLNLPFLCHGSFCNSCSLTQHFFPGYSSTTSEALDFIPSTSVSISAVCLNRILQIFNLEDGADLYIETTGRNLNDLGLYSLCSNSNGTLYSVGTLYGNKTFGTYILGMCFPLSCLPNDIHALNAIISAKLEEQVELQKSFTGGKFRIKIRPVFYEEYKIFSEAWAVSTVVSGILISAFIMGLIGTCVYSTKSNNGLKIMEGRRGRRSDNDIVGRSKDRSSPRMALESPKLRMGKDQHHSNSEDESLKNGSESSQSGSDESRVFVSVFDRDSDNSSSHSNSSSENLHKKSAAQLAQEAPYSSEEEDKEMKYEGIRPSFTHYDISRSDSSNEEEEKTHSKDPTNKNDNKNDYKNDYTNDHLNDYKNNEISKKEPTPKSIPEPITKSINESSLNDDPSSSSSELKLKLYEKILLCFAYNRNYEFLFQSENAEGDFLNIFYGIKALCFIWVVEFNTFFLLFISAVVNSYNIEITLTGILGQFIVSAIQASNVFFFISGFLAFYHVSTNYKTLNLCIILKLYGLRILRLFPPYFAVFLFGKFIVPMLTTAPIWYTYEKLFNHCVPDLYSQFLFLYNFFSFDHHLLTDTCIFWSWQVFADAQLFLLIPPLILLDRHTKQLLPVLLLLLLLSTILTLSLSFTLAPLTLTPLSVPNIHFFEYIMRKPTYSLCAFTLGILLSKLFLSYKASQDSEEDDLLLEIKFRNFKRMERLPKFPLAVLLLLSLSIMLTIILVGVVGEHGWQMPSDSSSSTRMAPPFFFALNNLLFIGGGALLLIPAMFGRMESLVKICGEKCVVAVGKLAYSGYLVGPMVIAVLYASCRESVFITPQSVLYLIFGNLVAVVAVAFLLKMLVELPFENLKNVLAPKIG